MSMCLPSVSALKRRKSAGSRHGKRLPRPMTSFSAAATISSMRPYTPAAGIPPARLGDATLAENPLREFLQILPCTIFRPVQQNVALIGRQLGREQLHQTAGGKPIGAEARR